MIALDELLTTEIPLFAHIGRAKNETLLEHSELVMDFCKQLQKENGLRNAIKRTIAAITYQDKSLTALEREIVEKWFYHAIYFHDLGKVNPAFQYIKMKNEYVPNPKHASDSTHSLLSAVLYLELFVEDIERVSVDEEKQLFLRYILYLFSYVISRHHSYLENIAMKEYQTKLGSLMNRLRKHPVYLNYYLRAEQFLEEFNESCFSEEEMNGEEHGELPLYVLLKLLFSALVSSDFYATYTYGKDGNKPVFRYLTNEDKVKLRQYYNNTKVVKGINAFRTDPTMFSLEPINKLRSQIFLESEEQIELNSERSIFYLEAPTGSGKTNTSINLALKLLETNKELNKIVYVFPFNTLVEQTKASFDRIFPEALQKEFPIAVVNSVTPIVHERELRDKEKDGFNHHDNVAKKGRKSYSVIDYKEEVLYRQMLQYPITLTSHVNFFHYLFGVGREANLAFVHLCNSVIILDEIQSYRNERWIEMIRFLKIFADLLNIKIVIMSATLPKLDRLLEEQEIACELLPNSKNYFSHPLFKQRVTLHFDHIYEGVMSEERLMEILENLEEQHGKKRILIELISKQSAYHFYRFLKEHGNFAQPIILLTGDDHAYYRKKVISLLMKKNGEVFSLQHVLVIATQVIEAGVDIDMDIGLKDISTLDGEEQFLGRINRSCLRTDCHVYFFHKDDAETVYKKDFRLQHDIRTKEYQDYLMNKDFTPFYERVFEMMIKKRNEWNDNHLNHFLKQVRELQFLDVAEHMKLIVDKKYELFISHVVTLEDGRRLDGNEIWRAYTELLKDKKMDFSERRIKLSVLAEKMSFFTYSVYYVPKVYDENIGNLYFIKNGEPYLELDPFTSLMRFSEEKYKEGSEGMFL